MKLDEAKVATLLQDVPNLDNDTLEVRLQDSVAEVDYDGVILSLVKKYCPSGLLGLALTALLASFMSGMAGNVTAFNTVWTYDLYQAYLAPKKSDEHYLWMGRAITVVGILLSIACAYFASNYSNAMDMIQLVFGFVNAPLFATFVLGHVLGPHHRPRRLLRPARRDGDLGPLPRADPRHGQRPGDQGRLPRRRGHVPERDGAELLAGQLRLPRLLHPHASGSPSPRSGPRPTRSSRASSTR